MGTPVGIASARFTLIFSLTTGTIKINVKVVSEKQENMRSNSVNSKK